PVRTSRIASCVVLVLALGAISHFFGMLEIWARRSFQSLEAEAAGPILGRVLSVVSDLSLTDAFAVVGIGLGLTLLATVWQWPSNILQRIAAILGCVAFGVFCSMGAAYGAAMT